MSTATRDGCDTLDFALRYISAGLSIIPIRSDGSKRPSLSTWKPYQSEIPTEAKLRSWFGNCAVRGIAAIGGRVSGGLETIDVDDPELVEPYMQAVEALAPGLLAKLTHHRTPRPGAHFAYRCDEVQGNQDLAQSEPVPQFDKLSGEPVVDEKTGQQKVAPNTLIETRGEGGYIVVPGTPAQCHPTGRLYEHVGGPSLFEVQQITVAERAVLFRAARQFSRYVDEGDDKHRENGNRQHRGGLRPGDDYNQRADWQDILIPHGWEPVKSFGAQTHWRRPGKSDGTSATTGNTSKAGNDLLCVFSTNAHPFQGPSGGKPCTSYSKFKAFTLLNHGDNFEAATKALAALGYGESRSSSEADATTKADPLSLYFSDARTERGNSRRLIHRHGQDVRYCALWDKWLIWDGRRWLVDQTRRIETMTKGVLSDLWDEVSRINKTEGASDQLKQAVTAFAKSSNSANGVRNTLALARSEPDVPILPEALDSHPWLLNTLSGTVDLRTGSCRPHSRDDLLTKLAPVEYHPTADCPGWLAFLERIMAGNQSLIGFLQRATGMSLTGIIRDHVLLVCYGTGRNGKSVYLNTIQRTAGDDYAMKAAADLLMTKGKSEAHPTEKADLFGKRFISCIEVEDGHRLAESLVKELTGGDRVRARRMREDFWEFDPQHHLWLAVNHKPVVRGTDEGIWRRLKLIPFAVTIPPDEQDDELPEKLAAELPGILAWAVQGARDWFEYGLGEPEAVKAATASYRGDMDTLGEFLDEVCAVGPEHTVRASDLYDAYKEWAVKGGEFVQSKRKLGLLLAERGVSKYTSDGMCYRGLTLQSQLKF